METQLDRGAPGRPSQTAEEILAEARKAFFVMLGFLGILWAIQVANWAGHYSLDSHYGIEPHRLSGLPDIFLAPLLHFGWGHIEANSGPLFIFGFLAAYRGVRKFLGVTLVVAITSGLTVWLFQGSNVETVGASGLIFGYFSYVVVRGLFDRHLLDTLVGVVIALCYAYTLTVVVPGTPGVSWLAHLGGLVGGLVCAWAFRERGGRRPALRSGEDGQTREVPKFTGDGSRAALHKELEDLGL